MSDADLVESLKRRIDELRADLERRKREQSEIPRLEAALEAYTVALEAEQEIRKADAQEQAQPLCGDPPAKTVYGRIVRVLRKANVPMTVQEIFLSLDLENLPPIARNTVRINLSTATQKKPQLIENVSHGTYALLEWRDRGGPS